MKTRPLYDLVTWPDSQPFIGDETCHLVLPPEGEETELDSAYMVPSENGEYEMLAWPDSQGREDEPGALSDYEGNVFVPAA